MPPIAPLEELKAGRFDVPEILRKLASSSRALAELKGMVAVRKTRAPVPLAISAMTGAAPEPVPPPRPVQMKTMS